MSTANYRQLLPAAAAVLCMALPLRSQTIHSGGGTVVIPDSSIAHPGDAGQRMRTSVRIFIPDQRINPETTSTPPVYETPASLACIYKLVAGATKACNQATTTTVPTGGSGAIAVVDAYHDPTAASDLATFDSIFGLAAANFHVVYAAQGSSTQTSTPPPQDPTGGWEFEESLDIEMAHAFAPKARIYLVEAYSNNNSDLYPAVQLAASLVAAAGGGEVSMSWSGGEYSGETSDDATYFSAPGIVYFAASGDAAGVGYPCTSPNVVCVGGTTLSRNAITGDFEQQSAWSETGGGSSAYESIPSYQSSISSIVGTHRGVPDVSSDADTRSPVFVVDSQPINGQYGPYWLGGGTSVGTPMWAAIVNTMGRHYTSSNAELTAIYGELGVTTDFADIVTGNCGVYAGLLAQKGWDFCTGVGVNVGRTGK